MADVSKVLAIVLGGGFALVAVVFLVLGLPDRRPDDPRDMTLHWFTGVGANKDGTLLFVHGLGGDADGTWRHEDHDPWMKMAAEDERFRRFAIASVDYDTALAGRPGSISQVAQQFARVLDRDLADRQQIVIVAHSLGGVVARAGIAASHFDSRAHQQITLITLASPFGGCVLSKAADRLPTLGFESSQLSQLARGSDVLAHCRQTWKRTQERVGRRIRQFAAFESEPTVGFLVVTKESATDGVPEEHTYEAEQCDHLGIAKPTGLSNRIARKVTEWILAGENLRVIEPRQHDFARDLVRPAGSVTEIQAGAVLRFGEGARLLSYGRIEARGTEEAPIVFEFAEGGIGEGAILLRGADASRSTFEHCRLRYGSGIGVNRPDPRTLRPGKWQEAYSEQSAPLDRGSRRHGGAVLCIAVDQVRFEHCAFEKNEAWQGGAIALLGSTRTLIRDCTFAENSGVYGGGAVFAQCSGVRISKSSFQRNRAGVPSPTYAGETRSQYACGGAMYVGVLSFAVIHDCRFVGGSAQNAGGALYFGNTHFGQSRPTAPCQVSACRFEGNVSRRPEDGAGGAIRLDTEVRLEISESAFADNRWAAGEHGQHIWDQSDTKTEGRRTSGLVLTNVTFERAGTAVEPVLRAAEDRIRGMPRFVEAPIEDPDCYRRVEGREIDTIVIHHVSALFWDDAAFQRTYSTEVEALLADPELAAVAADPSRRKFDWRLCRFIFECYDVSAHYLIDRGGTIRRLVPEQFVAYHAGVSQMPPPDGRENVNEFSVGIELISSHPDNDPTITQETAYTDEQYDSLAQLLAGLVGKYGLTGKLVGRRIVGHDQIAGVKAVESKLRKAPKTDPGPLFDWDRVERELAKALDR